MAIVSCTECGKRLKVSDASLGKKVKCSCGQVFVAEEEAPESAPPPRPAPAPAASAEKVLVACSECGAKLKVGKGSLGKKMKCPKCTAIFVAKVEEQPAPDVQIDTDDDEPTAPSPKLKAKGKPARDEEDDLFSFAQADGGGDDVEDLPRPKPKPVKKPAPIVDEDEDDMLMPAPKGKAKKLVDDDDDDGFMTPPPPKGKAKKPLDDDDEDDDGMPNTKSTLGMKPSRSSGGKKDEPLKYPSRLPVNIIVFLMLFAYLGAFAAFFLDQIPRDMLEDLGWPKNKLTAAKPADKGKGKTPEVKGKEDRKKIFRAREAEEKALLTKYREVRPEAPIVRTIPAEGTKLLALAFSPAGHQLATLANSPDSAISLWNLADLKKPEKEIPVQSAADLTDCELAFSHDGKLIALLSHQEHDVKVFDVKDAKEVAKLDLGKGTPTSFAFAADGSLIVVVKTAGEDHDEVKLYDSKKKWDASKSANVFKNGWSVVSLDGTKIIEVNKEKDELAVRDVATGKSVTLKGDARLKQYDLFDGAISADGAALVLGHKKDDTTHQLLKFELKDKGEATILHEGPQPAVLPRLSPDGKHLICKLDGNDHLIDVEAKASIWSREADSSAYAFSPGGIFLASGLTSADKATVHLMPIEELKTKEVTPPKKEKEYEKAIAKSFAELFVERQKEENGWLAGLRAMKIGPPVTIMGKNPTPKSVAFSPVDLAIYAQGDEKDEAITLWNVKGMSLKENKPKAIPFVNEFDAHFPMTFSHHGALLAIGASAGEVLKVWEVTGPPRELHAFNLDKGDACQEIAFTPDGKRVLALVSSDGKGLQVAAWNLSDGSKSVLPSALGKTAHILLGPNGDKVIEISKDASVMAVHDTVTGKSIKVKPAPDLGPNPLTDRALSPDTRWIACNGGTEEKPEFLLHDLDKGGAMKLFDGSATLPCFSPDSKYLICHVKDEHRLMEVASGKVVWTRKASAGGYAFSAGGVFLAIKQMADVQVMSLEDALAAGPGTTKPKEKDKTAENKDPKLAKFLERQKDEKIWLDEYRKSPPKDLPGVAGILAAEGDIVAVAFAPVEQLFATAARSKDKDGIKIWDLATLESTKTLPVQLHTQRALLAFSSGELIALITDKDKDGQAFELTVWKTDGTEVKSITIPMSAGFSKDAMGLQFTSDGKRLTLLLKDQGKGYEAIQWDVADWKEKKWNPQSMAGHCFFSQSGDTLYESMNPGGEITIRDLINDKTRTFTLKDTANPADRITPDEKYYVNTNAGALGDFQLVDMNSGAAEKLGREKAVNRLLFSGDAKYMLYALGNTEAKMVDIATKKEVWKAPGAPLMVISPGGVFVARVEKAEVQLLAIEDLLAGKYKPKANVDPKEKAKVTPPLNEIDPKLANAWTGAGAEFGWIGKEESGVSTFFKKRPTDPAAVPGFVWKLGDVNAAANDRLLDPGAPFAVQFLLTKTSDAEAKALARFKRLRGLNLQKFRA